MQALPYAIPAAAAALAYLDGRHAISYDLKLLGPFVATQLFAAKRHERNDDINLFYALENHAKSANAGHVWIIFQGKQYTYAQAYEIVLKYGTWLKSKGVQKNEIVAMDFMNSELFIWIWFGLWSIGAKPAFINYNLTGKPLLHTIRTSTARLVLVGEESRGKFSEDVMAEHGFTAVSTEGPPPEQPANYHFHLEGGDTSASVARHSKVHSVDSAQPQRRKLELIFFDKGLEAFILETKPIRQPNSERGNQQKNDMAMLIYTSGTTGLPKPAVMAWGKATLGSKFVAGWIPIKKTDVMYTSMPLYHSSASVLGVCAVLNAGATICLSKKFSHKTFWPEVRSSNATIIHYVGETCRYLLSAPPSDQDKSHRVYSAFGNGLRPDVWQPFKDRFNIGTILEFYAATEAPGGMWNRSTNSFSAGAIGRNGTLAHLLMGSSLCVVKMDPESEPPEPLRDLTTGLCKMAGWNEPGELLYKLDPQNISLKFQGYFGNDKATNSKIIRNVKAKGDAYFRTGDLMRWDKEGRWYFVDRIGDTFRWKAENVSTAEVADIVGRHPAIEEANVYGVLVPRHDGRAGCAAVVLKPGESVPPSEHTLKSLAEHMTKTLPGFAVPLFIRVTREMHTTGTNKQQKHLFQRDGIDVRRVEEAGDVLYWLKDATYQRFTERDLERMSGGLVKL
ncbi:long-chain fatty acid transporter-like protein [Westerdykella ornata]|uniref:Long-chain fatty acid transporter-like protein n=1 Tax=Westerdykella ornata TaxID=318751 RepID=A0A6A6JJ53_WESOR|nr:long-chain fatty acid transporter-like protein [Westerdykella ornata]KAF2275998.1 long-chain fatty acid transporter-like protein [Westerdykella ornata]